MVLGGTYGKPDVLEGFESWGVIFTSYSTPFHLVREIVQGWIGEFDVVVNY